MQPDNFLGIPHPILSNDGVEVWHPQRWNYVCPHLWENEILVGENKQHRLHALRVVDPAQ